MRQRSVLAVALSTALSLAGAAAIAQPAEQAAPALPEPAIRMVPKAENVAGFLDCIVDQKATIVSAHRGGPKPGFPENAIETFAYTLSKIPAIIELDIVKAKDGYVLMHDSDLNRTTTGSGPVAEKTVAELKELALRDQTGFAPRPPMRIATLEETLAWAKGQAIIQLDLKRGVDTAEIVAIVQKAGAQRYTAIIVDNAAEAAIVAKADPTISMSYGVTKLEALEELAAAGVPEDRIYAFTGVNRENKELWDELERRGIPAIFATLWSGDREIAATNDEAKYARLSADGVDIMVTDRHFDAYWAMEERQDIEAAVKACVQG
ncbi:MAG: hypothetical protein RLY86_1697 [Pseudomonadota bacterium]|jgi:glycerophosphoryl diester phosphodiesterase